MPIYFAQAPYIHQYVAALCWLTEQYVYLNDRGRARYMIDLPLPLQIGGISQTHKQYTYISSVECTLKRDRVRIIAGNDAVKPIDSINGTHYALFVCLKHKYMVKRYAHLWCREVRTWIIIVRKAYIVCLLSHLNIVVLLVE